nr:MFS transporter [uncultured Lichenicoccus sp.]
MGLEEFGTVPSREPVWTPRGSHEYRRIVLALFLSGYATFSLLYCVQPLLPLFSQRFHLDAARSALSLSLATGLLAPSILVAGALSETLGRKSLMAASLAAAAVLNLLCAATPGWTALLVLRALEGLALGGAPAVAMAYLAEEIYPSGLGLAMGLYVGGTAIGGMAGRLLSGLVAEFAGWRAALAAIGLLGAASAACFVLLLPASRNFARRSSIEPAYHAGAWLTHLRTPGLPALFAVGGLLMGSFVTLYNATGYRLLAPPYDLNQAEVGAIFVIYLLGTFASTGAGLLTDRIGRRPVLVAALLVSLAGVGLTLAAPLVAIIAGLALFTVGFFAGHAVASGSVGRLAGRAKGHAASLYLLSYYLGSSLLSIAGGAAWEWGGWNSMAGFCALLLVLALVIALLPHRMRTLPAVLLVLSSGTLASPAAGAATLPPFMQQMMRAELPDPFAAPPDMKSIAAIRISGIALVFGRTGIDRLATGLGVRVRHQGDAGDSVYWTCARLDVPARSRSPRDEPAALTLWLISDAEATGPAHAVTALALDSIRQEGRSCPVPEHEADLTLDARIIRPGTPGGRIESLYGHAPKSKGRSAFVLPSADAASGSFTLTLSMRDSRAQTVWLTETPDN